LYRTLDPAHEPDDAWYAAFVQSGEEYTVMIGQDNENSDAWTLFTDMRIEDEDGTFLGVCGMALELPDLQQRLREYEEQYDMRVCFVDRDGVEQLQSGSMEDATDTITLPQEALEQKFVVTQTDWHGTCTVIRHLEELDWYMVIEDLNPYDYTNDYMLVSINAAIFALFLVLTVLALYYILKQERILTIHSYHDRLTGILNRRAFEEDVQCLRDGAVPDSVWVVAFDVNGLKQVNDTDGHAAGDELVMAAAQLIFCSFGAFGRCYRMGGDEFLALMDRQPEDVEAMLRHFEAQVADWHGTQVEAIDIAYGTAHAADHPGSSIDELVFLADEAMYRKKREHYSREQQTQNRP
jgi:diguanylate cyclase (GGDEF)-like protein